MAFIQIDPADNGKWSELRFARDFRHGQTSLAAAGDGSVIALPDIALDDLDENGIRYSIIEEGSLERVLSPKGFEYYELLKQRHPENLYFDAELPPALHVAMFFSARPALVPAAKQVLERNSADQIRVDDDVILVPIAAGSEDLDAGLLKISCVIPRDKVDAVVEDLSAAGIAGYSRETAVYTNDPDRNH